MNHIFGPVNSRRLGRSLGIDLLPRKVCNLNCIYCEVGATTQLTCERKEYIPTTAIIAEITEFCADPERLNRVDVVTVTASGEPTLHSGLGRIITALKTMTGKPVAVLTNGTTLMREDVVAELSLADVVIPSLDTARPASFRKLNRPATCLDLQEIIEGLVHFSKVFTKELWLEILFAQGINDSDEEVQALVAVIRRMTLSRVQLNTVARPPLESFALPVGEQRLKEIADLISSGPDAPRVDILTSGSSATDKVNPVDSGRFPGGATNREETLEKIIEMLKRRPCTAADIDRTCQMGGPEKVEQFLEPLVRSGQLKKQSHGDKLYYQ
ncbi:molybdenum cofactor biosynthesis protein A [bacterium BMS3Bbin14]|nr:molybdenum cofactor biosynthesis protein A [bacterium BMS3Abin13]GBE51615.1 molybdenum cofactor biosynthesis protein A [bacterium BMS3Bbin14]